MYGRARKANLGRDVVLRGPSGLWTVFPYVRAHKLDRVRSKAYFARACYSRCPAISRLQALAPPLVFFSINHLFLCDPPDVPLPRSATTQAQVARPLPAARQAYGRDAVDDDGDRQTLQQSCLFGSSFEFPEGGIDGSAAAESGADPAASNAAFLQPEEDDDASSRLHPSAPRHSSLNPLTLFFCPLTALHV